MKTILVDDEMWTLTQLKNECGKIPDVQILNAFDDPYDALSFVRKNEIELAFLDVEMPGMTGLELARHIRDLYPDVIIIFVSAFDKYMTEAFRMQADYYVMKPYTHKEIENVMERARLLSKRLHNHVKIYTFGSFDVFVNDTLLVFPDKKVKELLAFLVSRRGESVSEKTILQEMWGIKEPKISYTFELAGVIKTLKKTLEKEGIKNILTEPEGGIAVKKDMVDCDYFKFLDGDVSAISKYNHEFMTDYPWAREIQYVLDRQLEYFTDYSLFDLSRVACASICYLLNDDFSITFYNDAFLTITGFTVDEIREKYKNSLKNLICEEDFETFKEGTLKKPASNNMREVDYRLKSKDSTYLWVMDKGEFSVTPDGKQEMKSLILDISDRKNNQLNLQKQAERDPLTGLYNRVKTEELIKEHISKNNDNSISALLLIDIDDFKSINDTYGHPFGDTVIVETASAIKNVFRSTDIAGRIGGDEMLVFVKDIPKENFIKTKINDVFASITGRSKIRKDIRNITCSIGVSFFPSDGSNFETLYRHADTALYAAKEKGKCQAAYFCDTALCEFFLPKKPAKKESEKTVAYLSHLMAYAFNQLYETKDLFETIKVLMSITGHHFDISNIDTFELTSDSSSIVRTLRWENIESENIENAFFPVISENGATDYSGCKKTDEGDYAKNNPPEVFDTFIFDEFIGYLNDNKGIAVCKNSHYAPLVYDEIIKATKVKSFLCCGLYCNNTLFGAILFSDFKKANNWSEKQINSLSELARLIGMFLRNYRLSYGYSLEELKKNK